MIGHFGDEWLQVLEPLVTALVLITHNEETKFYVQSEPKRQTEKLP